MLKKPDYKKLDLQVFATFFEIYSGKASAQNVWFIKLLKTQAHSDRNINVLMFGNMR